jgi:hypothetical protein
MITGLATINRRNMSHFTPNPSLLPCHVMTRLFQILSKESCPHLASGTADSDNSFARYGLEKYFSHQQGNWMWKRHCGTIVPHWVDELVPNLHCKTIALSFCSFFACNAPAIAFGVVYKTPLDWR